MTTQLIVTVNHVRQAKLCARGARQWFGLHGLDWNEFITKGLPIERLEALNDAFATRACQCCRDEAAGEEE